MTKMSEQSNVNVIPYVLNELGKNNKQTAINVIKRLIEGEVVTIVEKNGELKKKKVFIDEKTADLCRSTKSVFDADGKKRLIGLRDISYVVEGACTEAFLSNKLEEKSDCCFSIVYSHNGCKTIDILCDSPASRKTWVEGLTSIVAHLSPTTQTVEDVAEYYFNLADTNQNGKLSITEVCGLLERLHLKVNRRDLKRMIKLIEQDSQAIDRDNQLNRQEFRKFVEILYQCNRIRDIFDSTLKENSGHLDRTSFEDFLQKDQNQTLVEEEFEKLTNRFEMSLPMRGRQLMGYEGFRSYLMSEENSVNRVQMCGVYQDMTQPLTNYWMFSSHNTYLIGNQLTGESSTNGYISALRRGCRCVEIDCWDGKDGEPVATHGWTLTSDILIRDVIVAIKSAAFAVSPYPVLLSLENHCSKEQQKRIAEHMIEIFGDSLCTSLYDPQDPSKMLSPEALKYKFLIKGKILKSHRAFNRPNKHDADEDDEVSDEESSDELIKEKEKEPHAEVCKELSDITTVPSVKLSKLGQNNQAQSSLPFAGVSSLAEGKLAKVADQHLNKLVEYTKNYFVRVYPFGLRFDSSNYNPMTGLAGGCQIVALNFQTTDDKFYNIYKGFFTDNGNCGYILKQLSPSLQNPMSLSVRVISGYQLGTPGEGRVRDIIDPYVIVRIIGVAEDMKKYKTKAIDDNGFNPIWDESFHFVIRRPDVALLRFIVMDRDPALDKDDYVSQHTVCVRLLAQGYRCVTFENNAASCLLVHITIA